MDSKEVVDQIVKPKLTEVFGRIACSIIVSNAYSGTFKAVSNSVSPIDTYKLVIESICSNSKVIAMWGENGAEKQKNEWLNLIKEKQII